MEPHSMVLTAEVEFEGQKYTATYYIEQDAIYANVEGRLISTALTALSAEQTVKSLLLGYLLQSHPKNDHQSDGVS